MGRYSRGSQLGSSDRMEKSRERKRRLSEKNKAQRREVLKGFAKKLLIVLAVLFGVYLISSAQLLNLNSSQLDSNYQATVDEYFSENPLSRYRLFFNEDELKNYIIQIHPNIGDIDINTPVIGAATISLGEKSPVFYWQTADTLYIGAADGTIYKQAQSEDSLEIPRITDGSSVEQELGDKVISSSTIEYLDSLEEELTNNGLTPVKYEIPTASRQVNVYLSGKKYFVKISLDRSVVGQLDELSRALKFINSSNISVKEYIDLRTPDKAFYK